MTTDEKRGTPWTDEELDSIVADYFSMLADELAGLPYIKSRHSAALMARIGRSHRSVEFKHQNISAVLGELGMPWIPGYRPKENYQNAIFGAIDRYLSGHESALALPVAERPIPSTVLEVFVRPPERTHDREQLPEGLKQLISKFDPVERDRRNRSLGKAGEEFVVELERRRLFEVGRNDLAQTVRWTSVEEGDGAGYDVMSFTPDGAEKFIEVKTTNGPARTPFFVTKNELDVARSLSTAWCLYRVHLFSNSPRIFTIAPPIEAFMSLTPQTWKAHF